MNVAVATQRRSNSRIEPLLDAAANRFARQGYRATTMREIAAAVDMLPGSVYCHFPSKEALLLEVYRTGVERLCARVDAAMASAGADPWARLENMLLAHMETVLDQSDYARVLIRVLPDSLPDIASKLRALRDRYERRFAAAVDSLALPPHVDRTLLRLFLLGAANWAEIWYCPDRLSPADITRQFIALLRQPMDIDHDRPR